MKVLVKNAIKMMSHIKSLDYTHAYTTDIDDDLAFLYCGAVNCAVFNLQQQRTEYLSHDKFMVENHQINKFLTSEKTNNESHQRH